LEELKIQISQGIDKGVASGSRALCVCDICPNCGISAQGNMALSISF
jgi:hypothetical protein